MPIKICIPETEVYDEVGNEFYTVKECSISLEHSLVSISKWESKWHKPFLSKDKKTSEELLDYIRCMSLTPNVDPKVFNHIPDKEFVRVKEYMENPMTATWFKNAPKGGAKQIVTSELIYYWMVALQIPFECQKWHINRLLVLIRVCNEKNAPSKKMSKRDIYEQNSKLNALRRAKLHTKG